MFLIYILLACLVAYASPLLGAFFFYVDSRFHDDLNEALKLQRANHTTGPYTPTILKYRRPRRSFLTA